MNLENLDQKMNETLTALRSTPEGSEEFKHLTNSLHNLQSVSIKEREMRLKEAELEHKTAVEQMHATAEMQKQQTYAREIDTRVADLEARERNDRRQTILAYSKIVLGTVGTIGSILVVAACEEERVLRSKGFGYVRNFVFRFL